jgi:hypothetical protein
MTMREEFEAWWGPYGVGQTDDPKDNALDAWQWCWFVAYRAGQEAMRERAAKACDHNASLYPVAGSCWESSDECARAVRALPID